MTNEGVLEAIDNINLNDCEEIIPGEVYKIIEYDDRYCNEPPHCAEFMIIVKDGVKVGGLYRMGTDDIHAAIHEEYRGKGIFSSFMKKGLIQKLWPENEEVEICAETWNEYYSKLYLLKLANLKAKNEKELEEDFDEWNRPDWFGSKSDAKFKYDTLISMLE